MQNIQTDSVKLLQKGFFISEDLFGVGSFLWWQFIRDSITVFLAIQKLNTNTFWWRLAQRQEGFSLKTHYRVVFTRLIGEKKTQTHTKIQSHQPQTALLLPCGRWLQKKQSTLHDESLDVKLTQPLTFELSALKQRSRLLQGEELLDGDKVVVYPWDFPVSGLSGRTWERGRESKNRKYYAVQQRNTAGSIVHDSSINQGPLLSSGVINQEFGV